MPKALSKLNHRGPDFQDYKVYSKVGLGHTRLSIIDLSTNANQPFSDRSGRYHLVFNGEIYNYRLLKRQLEESGISFRTESDTEVLLELLIMKGEKALHELNGFFSFLFYDASKDELLVARDRLGIKPLLWYEDKDKFIFSSEMPSMLEFNIDRSIDKQALNAYFSYTYIPAPLTLFEKVRKLESGHYLRISNGRLSATSYYTIEKKPVFKGSYEDTKQHLNTILSRSVERRLVADVPVGSFLSGGLDSSIIAMIAKEQKDDLRTFSIGFEHAFFNESSFAEQVAAHIGSRHETIVLNVTQFRDRFEQFLDCIDEPFADSSAFALYLLAEKTKQQVTVCLSGDGADELFGGYRKHQAELAIRSMSKGKRLSVRAVAGILSPLGTSRSRRAGDFNRKIQKLAAGLKRNDDQRYDEWCKWISNEDRARLLLNPSSPAILKNKVLNDMNDFLVLDQQFVLPNDMLKKVDLASMAHALEVRVPFCDHEVVEFANALPLEYKLTSRETKKILRDTFGNRLPAEIIKRSKKGFEIPLEEWLGPQINSFFTRPMFTAEYLRKQGLFNPAFVAEIIAGWKSNKVGERIYLTWALLVFQHWYHKNVYPHD